MIDFNIRLKRAVSCQSKPFVATSLAVYQLAIDKLHCSHREAILA